MSHVATERTSHWRSLIDASVSSDPVISVRGDLAFTKTQAGGSSRVVVQDGHRLAAAGRSGSDRPVDLCHEHLPRWSPDGQLLAFVSSESTDRVVVVGDAGRGDSARTSVADRWRVEDLSWSAGRSITLLVAPSSSDSAVGDGAVRGELTGPRVHRRDTSRRRLMHLAFGDGEAQFLDTGDVTVWEVARTAVANGATVAIVSDDASESGWYRSRLSLLDVNGDERVLHRPDWQIARPRVSPDGHRVVVVAGWSSDRGHVAGDAVLVDLVVGSATTWSLPGVDAVSFDWIDDSTLHFVGWKGARSAEGVVGSTGCVRSIEVHEHVLHGVTRGTGSAPTMSAAIVHRAGAAPEIATRSGTRSWEPVGTGPQHEVVELRIDDLAWTSSDGLAIEGILVTHRDLIGARCNPVVLIHGGPANLWTRAACLGAAALAEAGYAVVLPNPRGSVGRGQAFSRANLGDPGGHELVDVLAGVAACRRDGLVRDVAPGVVGGSYGGYLTAAAAVFGQDIAAAVVMYGHPDLISARFGSNNSAFYDILLGGPPAGASTDLYLSRSPVLHAHAKVPPTLVLHGEADRCTPVGQAEELFRALLDHGVATELVTYPGQGHGLRHDGCEADVWTRTIAWFDEHTSPAQVGH